MGSKGISELNRSSLLHSASKRFLMAVDVASDLPNRPIPSSLRRSDSNSVLLNKYDLGKLFGHGNFAKIYLTRNLASNEEVAVKVFSEESILESGLVNYTKSKNLILSVFVIPKLTVVLFMRKLCLSLHNLNSHYGACPRSYPCLVFQCVLN